MPKPMKLTTPAKFDTARASDYEEFYLEDADFGTECQESEVPSKILPFMHKLRDAAKEDTRETEEGEDVLADYEFTYHKGEKSWYLGIHEKGCPFNPSGTDHYFTETHYLGFRES